MWSFEEANAFAQQHLLRLKSTERRSDAATTKYRALYDRLTARDVDVLNGLLQRVGFVDAIEPPARPFDNILMNGATAQSVRRRVHFLAAAVARGTLQLTAQTQVIFLYGERPLFASETPAVLLDPTPFARNPDWSPPAHLPGDERAMDEMIWQQMLLPKALREHGILFVHAQKRDGAARAETADCVRAWVGGHHPGPGKALVVSTNPTIEYQKRVTEMLLHQSGAQGIEVACMGPEAELGQHEPAVRLGLLLDGFAGTLFRAKQEYDLHLR